MNFEQRSFSGKVFRPTPEVFKDEDLGLFIIATPWGARNAATKAIEVIKDYIGLLKGDSDITSPFPRLTCLSHNANNLRIAAMLANEQLYREDNSVEYLVGVELFAISIAQRELSWVQLGHPNIFLKRAQRGIVPLGSQLDLAMDVSEGDKLLAPLPSSVLGLDVSANFLVGSFIPQKNDQLIMLSRSYLPKSFFLLKDNEYSMKKMSDSLVSDCEKTAFWMGNLKI